MRRLVLGGLGTVLTLVLGAGSASAGYLIAPLEQGEEAKALTPELAASSAYRALAEDPASASIRVVQADPEAVGLDTAALALALGDGLDLRVQRIGSYVNERGILVWHGVVLQPGGRAMDFDPADTLMLVENGGKLTGNLRYQGQWYQILPVAEGRHVLVRVDRSRLPLDHSPGEPEPRVIPMPALSAGTPDKAPGDTVITVLVNYTPAAAATTGDMDGLIALAIAESNQGYANSGVAIEMQLAHSSQTTYTQSGYASTDRSRYQSTSDNHMKYIHTERTQHGADVGILLVSVILADDGASLCGQASNIGSTASTAFAVVKTTNCATLNYTFAHEIGHLQSARHNLESDGSLSPYAYGHGYRYGTSWRTIMGVASTCGDCPRLNYWSNPNKLYNGVPMGTATRADNARVLNTTRGTVAAFNTAPSCIPDGGFDDTLGQTSCCSGFAVSGSTYCTNPADWNNGWASCTHICGTPLASGCVPSGGVDDTLGRTHCCSGTAVPGSTFCNDPADYGDDWTTCAQICQ